MKRILMMLFMACVLISVPNISAKASSVNYNVQFCPIQRTGGLTITENYEFTLVIYDKNKRDQTSQLEGKLNKADLSGHTLTIPSNMSSVSLSLPSNWTYEITPKSYMDEGIRTCITVNGIEEPGPMITGVVTDSVDVIDFIYEPFTELDLPESLPVTGSSSRYLFLIGGIVLFTGSMFILKKNKLSLIR